MISRFFFPWAWRRSTYCWVAASVRIRVVAIRHSALLACRLPPWLRRCRTVCPDDAWTGLAPHSAAKDRSELIRSGLSLAAASSAEAVSGPTPLAARRAGLASAQRRRMSALSWLISASRVWYRRARCRSVFFA